MAYYNKFPLLLMGGLEPETTAYLAAMSSQPTYPQVTLINNLIKSIKSIGIWSNFDGFYIYMLPTEQASLINMVNPGTYTMTKTSTPSFTANDGWISGGAGKYLSMGVAPNALSNFALNDAHIGVYSVNEAAENTGFCGTISASTTVSIQLKRASATAGNASLAINDATFTQFTADGSSVGHFVGNRAASGTKELFKDGASVGTASVTSTSVATDNVTVLASVNTRNTVNKAQFFHIGSALSSGEIASLNTAIETYRTGVAAL